MTNNHLFQSVEKPRLADEIARKITQAIQEGRYLAGEVLPPTRELAVRFNVSRPVLREALSILQVQGFVTIRHGRGTFVKDPDTDILHVSIEDWLEKNYTLVENFYEARLAIEPACAARAAQLAQEEDIAKLKEILNTLDRLTDEGNTPVLVSADIDYHSSIARLSRNEFFIKMLDTLIVPETDVRKIVLRLPNHLPTTNKNHTEIFNAIAKHDPEAARDAMAVALSEPLNVIREFMKETKRAG